MKYVILNDIDNLDVDDNHYARRKADLENSLYKVYDKIEELENLIMDARAKRKTIFSVCLLQIHSILNTTDRFIVDGHNRSNKTQRRNLIYCLCFIY